MAKETDSKVAENVASHLLNIKAVKLNVNEPFTWASGIKSPIYCDNRRILSHPEVRDYVKKALSQKVKKHFPGAEVIAGVATGAIAHGVLVAQELNLPFVYVRSSQKGHGLGNQIEGDLPEGSKVAVIEDLVSTGQSSLAAVDALIGAKSQVLGMIAIFTYGLDRATENMESAKCPLYTLSNYNVLIKQAINMGVIHHSSLDTLEKWRENPQGWVR
jgi:orotate phosphoribosyltransferase